HLAHAWRTLRAAGWRRALEIVWRAGRYTRQNSWQLFFCGDVALRRPTRPLLRFHDRVIRPVTDNVVFDALATTLIALWFLVLLPAGCWLADR
ncbi:MAG: hypothetical protein ACRES8_00680, partial [Nevskiaceae bacterium]